MIEGVGVACGNDDQNGLLDSSPLSLYLILSSLHWTTSTISWQAADGGNEDDDDIVNGKILNQICFAYPY